MSNLSFPIAQTNSGRLSGIELRIEFEKVKKGIGYKSFLIASDGFTEQGPLTFCGQNINAVVEITDRNISDFFRIMGIQHLVNLYYDENNPNKLNEEDYKFICTELFNKYRGGWN